MRTEALVRSYMRDLTTAIPESDWQRLAWHAAGLIRMAAQLRNTYRARSEIKVQNPLESGLTQGDLFDQDNKQTKEETK